MNKKHDVYVVKRDGTKELFDVLKIKKSIEFATEGQGVNALQLESSIDQVIKNGVKTSDIQDNVIRHALQQATAQNPKWVNVAGRALAMQMWANFSLRGKSFYEVVQYNIKKGEYTEELNDFYSKEDIDQLGECIDHQRDLEHSYSSLFTVQKKYLGKYELNQHMHMVSAMRFGQLEPEHTRLEFVKNLYEVLSKRKISLATPFMANLRRGGNVASCFIISIDDDLNSIFNNVHRIAKISKNGGGIGIYLGNIRAKGSSVSNYSNAAGTIVQWVKIINDTLVAVNQSFTADTLIKVDEDYIRIDSLKVGDKVETHDGLKEIEDIFKSENVAQIVEIETDEGKVNITSGHPVMIVVGHTEGLTDQEICDKIENGSLQWKWKDAGELEKNDIVIG